MCTMNVSMKYTLKYKSGPPNIKSGRETNSSKPHITVRHRPTAAAGSSQVGGTLSPLLIADEGNESYWGSQDPCLPRLGSAKSLCPSGRLCSQPHVHPHGEPCSVSEDEDPESTCLGSCPASAHDCHPGPQPLAPPAQSLPAKGPHHGVTMSHSSEAPQDTFTHRLLPQSLKFSCKAEL